MLTHRVQFTLRVRRNDREWHSAADCPTGRGEHQAPRAAFSHSISVGRPTPAHWQNDLPRRTRRPASPDSARELPRRAQARSDAANWRRASTSTLHPSRPRPTASSAAGAIAGLARTKTANCASVTGTRRDAKLRRKHPALGLFRLQSIKIERRVTPHAEQTGGDRHPVEGQRWRPLAYGEVAAASDARGLDLAVAAAPPPAAFIRPALRQRVLQIILGAANQRARLRVTELSSVPSRRRFVQVYPSKTHLSGTTRSIGSAARVPALTGCGYSLPIAIGRRSSRAFVLTGWVSRSSLVSTSGDNFRPIPRNDSSSCAGVACAHDDSGHSRLPLRPTPGPCRPSACPAPRRAARCHRSPRTPRALPHRAPP